MLHKYFSFTKKRVLAFVVLTAVILTLQIILCGSMLARQQVKTEAGNAESAVIGILDKTELIRQKFKFGRKVVLKEFSISFGSFERKDVGDTLHIQMTDGDNNIVYNTTVPVDKITPNQSYRVAMDYTVTIPKGVTCCIKLSCSSKNRQYDIIPTVNTTNRTDPNTYLATMKMQTRKKSLNISYVYFYRPIVPAIVLLLEFCILFLLCFERITEYAQVLRKQKNKKERKIKNAQLIEEKAKEKRNHSKNHSAKIRYSKSNAQDEVKEKKKRKLQKKRNRNQWNRNEHGFSIKDFVKHCLEEPKIAKRFRIAMIIINPLLIMFFIELMNESLLSMHPFVWIFTWMLLFAIEFVLFGIIGNINIAMLIMDCILFPSGLANLILMNVRGTPFLPVDMMALNTAAEVSSTYKISLTPAQFVMLPAFLLWCVLIFRFKGEKTSYPLRRKIIKRGTAFAAAASVIMLLYNTSILEKANITDNVWNKVASCRSNGFYLNYFINLHYLHLSKPSGYSQEKIASVMEETKKENPIAETGKKLQEKQFVTNSDFGMNTTLNGKKPNIILIMNESLADYDQIGTTNFNRDPLSYIHSMEENTIYGKDYVSIYGAGTSNSEFEAMTGNTMKFFPSGCNVYQQFMHDSTYSLPYYLKSLGYSTGAIHPSSGANWNRINTYNSMRFDQFLTIDDFENPEYVRYISDKESYKKVIELYEKKEKDKPLFLFDMTIQNHGGYLTNTNWKKPVYLKGAYLQETKEYLSAIKVSDNAFRYLVEYFKKQEEPTIICMFGDHQPSIETEFYEQLLKKKQKDWELDEIQKRYVTPFVIWANYDIPESKNVVISNNYLENLLLKQSGIELPLYNRYVEKVSKHIPAMNVNGYMDASGNWHKYDTDESDIVKELLTNYELLQYGYYSDMDKEKMSQIFEMEK